MVSGALAGLVAYCNLPAAWILPAAHANGEWLSQATVQSLPDLSEVAAGDLWKGRAGAVVMAVRRPG